jgi:hypothetical protein
MEIHSIPFSVPLQFYTKPFSFSLKLSLPTFKLQLSCSPTYARKKGKVGIYNLSRRDNFICTQWTKKCNIVWMRSHDILNRIIRIKRVSSRSKWDSSNLQVLMVLLSSWTNFTIQNRAHVACQWHKTKYYPPAIAFDGYRKMLICLLTR